MKVPRRWWSGKGVSLMLRIGVRNVLKGGNEDYLEVDGQCERV